MRRASAYRLRNDLYPLLELLQHRPRSRPLVICQDTHEGTMTLGSVPTSQTHEYFKNFDYTRDTRAMDDLRVYLHFGMDMKSQPFPPYSCIIPGATNHWFFEHDCCNLNCPDDLDRIDEHNNPGLLKPVQDALVQIALSEQANVRTRLIIHDQHLYPHAEQLKAAIMANDPNLPNSLSLLCGTKLNWTDNLSDIVEPRRFGPFGMYRISTSIGIELVDFVTGGLEVTFEDFSLDDGDEGCPVCKVEP
ncbi:hypothetical protein IAT40_007246 [Kwoniella sp. CBS 6097]